MRSTVGRDGVCSTPTIARVLPALLPLRSLKDMRADLYQSRQHFKHRNGAPFRALAGAESTTVNLVGNARVRAFLNDEFHHLHQDFALCRILFQALSLRHD